MPGKTLCFVGLLFSRLAILQIMTYFNECFDEWHSLVQGLRLLIEQEYPCLQPHTPQVVAKRPVPAPKAPQMQPKAQTLVAPVVDKKPEPSVAKKPELAKSAPKPKEKEIPTSPLEPIMQALCRPITPPQAISLVDCLAAFQKLGIPHIDAPQELAINTDCQITFVSFFAPGSVEEKFIQKVASSVNERLIACSVYLQPGLTAAAECFTLAASGSSKAIVLAHALEDGPKLAAFLAYLGDDLKDDVQPSKISTEVLLSKKALFGTGLYDLIVTPATMEDVAHKRALWSDLQKFTQKVL